MVIPRPRTSAWPVPAWAFRYRGFLVTPPLLFALLWFREEAETPLLTWPLGLSLMVAGIALRVWAQQHVHHRLKLPMRLTVRGPYQFVRNPLYIGNLVIQLGATVLSELLWMIPVTLLWGGLVYALAVRYEEASLLQQYGEAYRQYAAEVPRWLPRWRRSPRPARVNQHLRPAVLSELHSLLLVLPFVLKEILSPFFEH